MTGFVPLLLATAAAARAAGEAQPCPPTGEAGPFAAGKGGARGRDELGLGAFVDFVRGCDRAGSFLPTA